MGLRAGYGQALCPADAVVNGDGGERRAGPEIAIRAANLRSVGLSSGV